MHLLILTSEFPPDLGGIATYLEHSARMLTRAGHHVTIIAPGDARCDKQLPDGTRLIRLIPHQTTSVPAFFQTLSHWPALSYEIAETAINHLRSTGDLPDVIEVQEYGALGYYLLQRRLVDETPLRDIPILVHLHSPHSENLRVNQMARYRFPDYWVGQMEKFCINAADALLSPSRFLRDKLLKQGFTDRSIDVIPYAGIDPSILIEDFDSPVDPQPEDIVYIGRLEVRKGVLPLVRVRSFVFGHYLVSMPFLNYGGPLGDGESVTALVARAVSAHSRRLCGGVTGDQMGATNEVAEVLFLILAPLCMRIG